MDETSDSQRIRDLHAALVAGGAIEPLSRGSEDVRLWVDCELASLVENRFFERLEPRTLTPSQRAAWEPRATRDGEHIDNPHRHAWYSTPYWLLDGGERVGTMSLSNQGLGRSLVTVSSLYVMPSHRGRGVAARALRAARAHGGVGLRVPTHWTWQPAVRFYLRLGMWIENWKHSLVFVQHGDLPEHRISIGEREARFGVVVDGRVESLISASREGDRLGWVESPRMESLRGEYSDVGWLGPGTFAVALAQHGYPLVRSAEGWANRRGWADCGEPEGLAYKIEIFEAIDRRHGFEIRAPRIPGLAYRDLDDIG